MKKLTAFLLVFLLFSGVAFASQNALVVPDGTGAAVRAGFNNGLNTLATLNCGPTAPSSIYPYMLWVDTTNNLLKIANSGGTGWVVVGIPSLTNLGLQPALPSGGTTGQYLRGDLSWQTYSPMVYPGAGVANSTGSAWGTSYMVGTAANNLVQLNSSGQLPAVSGANLTNLPSTGVTTQNLPSRAVGTVYHNTTGKPMTITISGYFSANGGCGAQFLTDANATPTTMVAQFGPATSGSLGLTMTVLVLSGNYYEFSVTSNTFNISAWTEWY